MLSSMLSWGHSFLNGSHMKSDGLVMQFDIHERIEDATWRRQWTEHTYPGRGWDENDTDIYPCEAGTFIRTAPSGFCEPWEECALREHMTKIVFETLNVPGTCVANQADSFLCAALAPPTMFLRWFYFKVMLPQLQRYSLKI